MAAGMARVHGENVFAFMMLLLSAVWDISTMVHALKSHPPPPHSNTNL